MVIRVGDRRSRHRKQSTQDCNRNRTDQARAIYKQTLNNRLEQDHRGVKGRYGPIRGFKCPRSAGDFCRAYDELRNFLRSRSRTNQQVSADYRRFHFLRRTATVLRVLEAA